MASIAIGGVHIVLQRMSHSRLSGWKISYLISHIWCYNSGREALQFLCPFMASEESRFTPRCQEGASAVARHWWMRQYLLRSAFCSHLNPFHITALGKSAHMPWMRRGSRTFHGWQNKWRPWLRRMSKLKQVAYGKPNKKKDWGQDGTCHFHLSKM